jgi:AcrR family transcriptional regulator
MTKTKDISAEEKILTAARRIFENKGMSGARMQEIADEAKINKSLLHYYYRSKQKLFEAVFKSAFNTLSPQINTILSSDESICEKITDFTYNYTTFMVKHPYLPNFILQELNRNPEFVTELISSKNLPGMKKFKDQIKEAVEKGKIKNIAAEQLFINILALNIFPFVSASLLKGFLETSDKEFKEILEKRKTEVAGFIIQSIKL